MKEGTLNKRTKAAEQCAMSLSQNQCALSLSMYRRDVRSSEVQTKKCD
jgi:hypothetical protein